MQALRPEPLEAARLPDALADVAARWSEVSGVPAAVTTTGTARQLHPEVEIALLRTGQEALANVGKHAAASRVGVTLSYMEDVVTLDVRDDGIGFDLGRPARGGRRRQRLRSDRHAAAGRPGRRPAGDRVRAGRGHRGLRDRPGDPGMSEREGSQRERGAPRPDRPALAPDGRSEERERRTAAGGGTIRLLIVDDHPVVRDGLRGMFSGEPGFEVVGEAASGAEAVTLVGTLAPDVVLMDLRMPGVDGVTATGRITRSGATARVLVLTTYDTDSDVLPAIEAGATGYLLKDSRADELFRAVRAAARGRGGAVARRWRPGCSARSDGRRRSRCPPASRRCSSWSPAARPTGRRPGSCSSPRRR